MPIVNENKIIRKNKKKIVNEYYEKVFKLDYDKRVINPINENNIGTYPYGY